jgi:hypothetical protein
VKISTTRGTPTGLPGVSRENLTKMLPGHLRNPSWLSEKLTFTRLSAKMPIKKLTLLHLSPVQPIRNAHLSPLSPITYQKSAPFDLLHRQWSIFAIKNSHLSSHNHLFSVAASFCK